MKRVLTQGILFLIVAGLAVVFLPMAASAQTTVNVTFKVDLTAPMADGTFDPSAGDSVEVAGSFNGWQNPPSAFLADADADSIYEGTFALTGVVGSTDHMYKYLMRRSGRDDVWESIPDRKLPHRSEDTVLPVSIWDVSGPSFVNVTFVLDMSVQMRKGNFDPAAGDSVEAAGSFNGWQDPPSAWLADADADSIYEGTFELVGTPGTTTHEYKYLMRRAAGDVWESVDNRKVVQPSDNTTLDKVYFDDDTGAPSALVNVTFQVDMSVKIAEGVFDPAGGDSVEVAGTFNEWQNPPSAFLQDPDGDDVYTFTAELDGTPGGTTHKYKYLIRVEGGDDVWEDNLAADRSLVHPSEDTTLAVVFYDDDPVVSVPASGNLIFQVDTTPMIMLGLFRRDAGDSLQVRGVFNGWNADQRELAIMDRIPGTETYFINIPHEGLTGDVLKYKFFIDYEDSAYYADTFGEFDPNFGWEEPAVRGGGDRVVEFAGGDQIVDANFYNDVTADGLINAGDTVTVTFNMDMNQPIADGDFDPATDRLFWENRIPIVTMLHGSPFNSPDSTREYQDGDGDGIYSVTFDIVGASIYNIHYVGNFGGESEAGGLGTSLGRHRVRYIQPNTDAGGAPIPNDFPREFTFPTDVWTLGGPHVVEDAPFAGTTSVGDAPTLQPRAYALHQNYPNPFNPATTIDFEIAQKGHAVLDVYNILGQRVATLLDKDFSAPGRYTVDWDGRNDAGRLLGSGIYVYRLRAGSVVLTKRLIMLK